MNLYYILMPLIEVSGTAFFTGRNEFWFDPDDPLREGFLQFAMPYGQSPTA